MRMSLHHWSPSGLLRKMSALRRGRRRVGVSIAASRWAGSSASSATHCSERAWRQALTAYCAMLCLILSCRLVCNDLAQRKARCPKASRTAPHVQGWVVAIPFLHWQVAPGQQEVYPAVSSTQIWIAGKTGQCWRAQVEDTSMLPTLQIHTPGWSREEHVWQPNQQPRFHQAEHPAELYL